VRSIRSRLADESDSIRTGYVLSCDPVELAKNMGVLLLETHSPRSSDVSSALIDL